MAFANELLTSEEIEKYDLPYKFDLDRPIEQRIKMTMDRERGIYLSDGGATGNPAFDDDIKTQFAIYLSGTKLDVVMEPCNTPGDFKADPYSIRWPTLLEIWAIDPKEQKMIEVSKAALQKPDEPSPSMNNYSFNQVVAILKEALSIHKAGYYNRHIHTPIIVSFGF